MGEFILGFVTVVILYYGWLLRKWIRQAHARINALLYDVERLEKKFGQAYADLEAQHVFEDGGFDLGEQKTEMQKLAKKLEE